jgi:transposase-like protein
MADFISYAVWLYFRFNLSHRDGAAAKRYFKRLLRSHGGEPRKLVTDKLRSYGVAHRELMPDVSHSTEQYENNRAEQLGRAIARADEGARTSYAEVQIIEASSTVLGCPCSYLKSVQPR